MRLYLLHKCPFGHRAAIALREKNLDFDLTFFESGKRPPELEAAGPRAKSPTLFDDNVKVHDSQVVLEYIEERYPLPSLMPKSAEGRAEVRMLITRYNDEVAPKFGTLISELLFKAPPDPAKIAEARQAYLAALTPWDAYFKDRMFAVGNALSLADITLYTFCPAAKALADIEIPAQLPHLAGWVERMRARPSTALPTPS
jgi:glutathione S-transferase